MKVTVIDGWQVKHGGKVYTGGQSFDASEADGKKLIDGGLVKAATASKATTSSQNKAQTSSANKATSSKSKS